MEENPNSLRALSLELLEKHRKQYGQAFERFYRPKILTKEPDTFQNLLDEDLQQISAVSRGGLRDKDFVEELEENGRKLSAALYKLAADDWEESINVYLRTIDDHSGQYTSQEYQYFIGYVQEIFRKEFGADRLERGESVELIDQITKRTGEETRERLALVLEGVDIQLFSRKIWSIYFSGQPGLEEKLKALLLDLTDQQIREVRLAFSNLSAELVAEELFCTLSPWNTPIDDGSKKKIIEFDSASDFIEEEEEEEEFIPEYDFEGFCYALKGREKSEVEHIELMYNDIFSTQQGRMSLREQIETCFEGFEQEYSLSLLEGVSLERIAESIIEILKAYDGPRPGLTPIEQGITGEGPISENLLGKVWRRRMYREDLQPQDVEIEAQVEIQEQLRFLSDEQVANVQELVFEKCGYRLNGHLYKQFWDFSPARIAVELRMSWDRKISLVETFQLFEGFTPGMMSVIKLAFKAAFSEELDDFLQDFIPKDSDPVIARFLGSTLKVRTAGFPRAELDLDILSLWEIEDESEPDGRILTRDAEEEGLHAEIVKRLQAGEGGTLEQLHSLLVPIASNKRFYIESDYATQTGELFRSRFEEVAPTSRELMTCLLLGSDIVSLASAVLEQPAVLGNQLHLSDFELHALIGLFERSSETSSLLEILLQANSQGGIKFPDFNNGLMAFYRPSTRRFHPMLMNLGLDDGLNRDKVFPWFGQSYQCLKGFENAYTWLYGSLRGRLKSLLTNNQITKRLFGDVILRLEGIDHQMIDLIDELIDAVDLKGLQEVFRKMGPDCATFEEAYDISKGTFTLHNAILDVDADRAPIDRTILFLEGYYPDTVAKIIRKAILSESKDVAVAQLEQVFSDPFDEQHVNPLLPNDLNWITEMYIQIRLAYFEEYSCVLMSDLISADIGLDLLERLTIQLFGADTVGIVREFEAAAKADGDVFVDEFISKLKDKPARYIAGIRELYDARNPDQKLKSVIANSGSDRGVDALKVLEKKAKRKKKKKPGEEKKEGSDEESKPPVSESPAE